jgi:2-polyprenyl-6-methoxyphenol hydroxylase-like FAD-dependent oxidoreductase
MYDAIVVGARCAGAATAMLLARRGHRVLLLDRGSFPSDMRLSNHLVWQPGVAALRRWGLLDELARSGCPAMTTGAMDLGAFVLRGRVPPAGDVAEAYAPRRRVLDTILVEAAVRAGAELREQCTVDGLVGDGTAVRGVTGRGPGGRAFRADAPIVVGADGMRSLVARLVAAPAHHQRPARQGVHFSYWSGVPVHEPTLYLRPRRTVVTVPTHDDLTVVSVSRPIADFRAARSDVAGHFLGAVDEHVPELGERLRAGRREERWVGAAVPGLFRRPFGPGWALVGDAGYLKDPCTAQGITDAFHHAELLADAVDAGLRGERPMGEALADYERRRDAAVMAMYAFTDQRAGLEPPTPAMQDLLGSLRGDRARTEQFFGVFAGTVPVQDVFGPTPQQSAA